MATELAENTEKIFLNFPCFLRVPWPNKITQITDKKNGFTLFEVMVAVLLLAMVSSMIYSILNVSIKFTEKGENQILKLEREHGLLTLLQRQITSAWYDSKQKQVPLVADDNMLRVVTRESLLYPYNRLVLALYRYDPDGQTLYYTEKRDFYNIDYDDEYVPELDDMIVLMENCPSLSFTYEDGSSSVGVVYDEKEFEFTPWCQTATRENAI